MFFKKKKKAAKSEPAAKAKQPKAQAVARLKTTFWPGLLRIALWTLIVLIFARGIVSMSKKSPTDEMLAQQKVFLAGLSVNTTKISDISSFAESFLKAYCTYKAGEVDSYRYKLNAFAGEALSAEIAQGAKLIGDARATFVRAIATKELSQSEYDVTVMVDVEYKAYIRSEDGNPEGTRELISTATHYYKIPIFYDRGLCIVENTPVTTVLPPRLGSYSPPAMDLTDISDGRRDQVATLVGDFFNALFSESQNKINYYLSDIDKAQGFPARDKSLRLQKAEVTALYETGKDRYTAHVKLIVRDVNGSEFIEKLSLMVVKKDRYLVEAMELRTNNIY